MPWLKRSIIAILCLIALIFLLEFFGAYTVTYYSAICPKCLQHAYLTVKEYLGFTIYKKTELSQSHGGLMSPAAFSPQIPSPDPRTYDEIHGKKCDHVFKKGGFGRSEYGILLVINHADGICMEWTIFSSRIAAVEILYLLYNTYQDKSLALKTYNLIDRACPIDSKTLKKIDIIHDFTSALNKVQTKEEWEKEIASFEIKLKDQELKDKKQ